VTPEWSDAIERSDVDGMRRLLDAGADVNARDRHNQTGLMIAAQHGRPAVVRLLIDRGADLNAAAKYTLSAIMLAVINGHVDIVRMLAGAGADLALQGSGAPGFAGKTALDLAVARGEPAMIAAVSGET
jgi:ankyrin repeat protein